MENLWKKISNDFKAGNNIDLYILIPVSMVFCILNLFIVINFRIVLSLSVALLSILAISLLFFRHKMEMIFDILKKEYSNESYISRFPEELFINDIDKSKKLIIVGTHIHSFLTANRDLLEQKAKRGDKMCFLLISPDSNASKMAIMRYPGQKRNLDMENQKIKAGLDDLMEIKSNGINVEIKTIDFLIDYTGYIVDDRIIYIEHHTFKISGGDKKPKSIYHNSSNSNSWYNHIKKEINLLWDNGNEYCC